VLISHQKKFIFVHVFKNAGTSIETALLPYATYNRAHYYTYRAMRNITRRINEVLWLAKLQPKLLLSVPFLPLRWHPQPLRNHATASQIAEKIGWEKYQSYFSFSVVRNPWDRFVSRYKYVQRTKYIAAHDHAQNSKDFTDFLRWDLSVTRPSHSQKRLLFSESGEQLVDFICRYDYLQEDFAKVCAQIGIDVQLPHLNVSTRHPYQEYYTPETIELVRKACAEDIETFGYEYE
jgi:hypothetical protein